MSNVNLNEMMEIVAGAECYPIKLVVEPCTWSQTDEGSDKLYTECGEELELSCDDLTKERMTCCAFCGKAIELDLF